jgi:hypothetical protein
MHINLKVECCENAKLSNPTAFKTIQIDEANKKKQRDKIRNCTGTREIESFVLSA